MSEPQPRRDRRLFEIAAECRAISSELRAGHVTPLAERAGRLALEASLESCDASLDAARAHLAAIPLARAAIPPAPDPWSDEKLALWRRCGALLDDLGLSRLGVRSGLEAAGIDTLEKLARRTRRELLELRGVGPAKVARIEAALAARGLSLLPDPSEA